MGWVSFEKWGERGVKGEESEKKDNGKVDEWREVEENEEEKKKVRQKWDEEGKEKKMRRLGVNVDERGGNEGGEREEDKWKENFLKTT